MDALQEKKLQDAGVDINGGVRRFAGKYELYEQFLFRFPSDPTFSALVQSMNQKDWAQALSAAHTLKGVAGNLGMNRLFHACDETVKHFRADDPIGAERSYIDLKTAYQDILNLLSVEEE